MRMALEQWDPTQRPTDSEMETKLLQAIRAHDLAEPVLQFEVRDGRGSLVGRVDAAYPDALLALEYDSKQEHSDEFQLAHDARRRNALTALGYHTLSARHADLERGGGGDLSPDRRHSPSVRLAPRPRVASGVDISDDVADIHARTRGYCSSVRPSGKGFACTTVRVLVVRVIVT